MFRIELLDRVAKTLRKVKKRNIALSWQIDRKIDEICDNPYHYKPLSGDMHGERRVHFGHFVLTFEIDEERKIVRILDYDHHDNIYEKN
jgi:mRNA-degrading endonuclease RelE of RelBE toxin-antitoxin system